jgi:signal transduction histidine kinase
MGGRGHRVTRGDWTQHVHRLSDATSLVVGLLRRRVKEQMDLVQDLRGRLSEAEAGWKREAAGRSRLQEELARREEELLRDRAQRLELEERLDRRTAELALEARRRDELLSRLAHELRNPLAPLLSTVELVRANGLSPGELEGVMDVLERQTRNMARLINDLLDVARVSGGRSELQKRALDLRAVIQAGLERARPLLEARRHEVHLSLPPVPLWTEGDSRRLEQVFLHLLENAARLTPPGGRVELWAEAADGKALARVRDNGAGLSPEMRGNLFGLAPEDDPSAQGLPGGLGLGLSLVRRLVEMHGGSIQVESEGLGRGTEFLIQLPLSQPPLTWPSPATQEAGAAGGEAGCRILLVDDNVDAARTLAMLLRRWGHNVQVIHDGPGALETASFYRPQLVILDLGLPGMDGYQVASRLRQVEGLQDTLLVALSAYGQEDHLRRSREAGFHHHLVKPVEPSLLSGLLSTLSSSRLQ